MKNFIFNIYLLTIFSIPFAGLGVIKTSLISVSSTNFLIILIFIILLFKIFNNHIKIKLSNMTIISFGAIFILFILNILSLYQVKIISYGVKNSITFFGYILCFLLTIVLVDNLYKFNLVLKIFSLSIILASLISILTAFGLVDFGARIAPSRSIGVIDIPFNRITPTDQGWSDFGLKCVVAIPYMIISILNSNNKWFRKFWVISLVITFFAAFLTQARAIWISLVGVFFFALLFIPFFRKKWFFQIILVLIGTICVGIVTVLSFGGIQELIISITNIGYAGKTNVLSRIAQYREALKLSANNPIFGVGVGQFKLYFWNEIYDKTNQLHNVFLKYLVSFGIIGLITYLILYFIGVYSTVITLVKSKKHYYKLIAGALTSILLGLFIILQFSPGNSNKILWIILALSVQLPVMVKGRNDICES